MIRLCRQTLILVIIHVAIISVARLSANAHPAAIVGLFTNRNGTFCELPCLFGLRPDETRFSDALALLKAHPLLGPPITYQQYLDYTRTQVISFSASWRGVGTFQGQDLWIGVWSQVGLDNNTDRRIGQVKFYAAEPILSGGQAITCTVSLGELINFLGP